ncbi:hypothetical protein G5714_021459 [Onychostoma macrolepis]|uniref:Immunoglobulin V-set domain-containing protein n=1 Tax=Onychostoma macrolepis TaxID=369639 RepID=A0A7J6BRT6_9TELE|nr:hypothetical protein G5714_021459 [Onychostoma macrolepis]
MEGESVTLNTDDTEIQRHDEIEWRFGVNRIARLLMNISKYDNYGRFRDRLKLDQNGSLTIANTRTTDSGLYQLSTLSENRESIKRFSVNVDAPPPAPAVTPQNPSSSERDAGNDTDVQINSTIILHHCIFRDADTSNNYIFQFSVNHHHRIIYNL